MLGDGGMTITGHAVPPLPQVPNQGGPLLKKLQLVTVSFGGYAFEQQIQAFGDWVLGSAWLPAVGHDYGVGTGGVHLAKVVIADAPATMLSRPDVEQLLANRILDGTLPAPTDGILYMVYFPPSVTLTLDSTARSCQDFAGYHAEAQTQQGVKFPFAAVPTCFGTSGTGDQAAIEAVASHELIEALTDPFPDSAPGYVISDSSNPWFIEPEIADLCTTLVLDESGHRVQRIWSNSAAAAGQQPCIPAATGVPYFNTSTPGPMLIVAPGSTTTVELLGYASSPVSDWTLDVSHTFGFDTAPLLGRTQLNDGQKTTLTLSVPTGTPAGSLGGVFLLSTQMGADPGRWIVAVRTP
jgi:hypothetical protein